MNLSKTLGIILFLATTTAQAQKSKIELGIEGGPNLTNLRGRSFHYDYKPMIYGSAGLSFQYHFSELISFRTGFGYEAKGFKSPVQENAWPEDIHSTYYTTYDYLNIPLMARFTFGEKIQFFVNAGGYFGILVNKRNHIDADPANEYHFHTILKNDKLDKYDQVDYGVSAGLGIRIPLNEYWNLSLEARANIGLNDIRRQEPSVFNAGPAASATGPANTNSGNLLLGLSYRIKSGDPNKPFTQINRISIGIEGGPNATFALGTNKPGNSYGYKKYPDYGTTTGLTFQWNSRKHFSLRTGICFEQKSFTSKTIYVDFNSGSSSEYRHINKFNYLTLPVLARFTFGKKVQFFYNAGVFVGYLNNQHTGMTGDSYYQIGLETIHTSYKESYDNTSQYNRFDLGITGGVGIGIPVKNHWYLSAEFRENFGLLDIYNASNYNTNTSNLNTFNLLLGISYKLGFREKNKL